MTGRTGQSPPKDQAKGALKPRTAAAPRPTTTTTIEGPEKKRKASTTPVKAQGPSNDEKRKRMEQDSAPEERPVSAVKQAASEIEERMLAYCLDPVKKVNKEQAAVIMRQFKGMRELVQELLLRNSFLEGKLEQAALQARKSETTLTGAVEKSLQATKSLERVVKKAEAPATLSYAEKVKMSAAKIAPAAAKPPKNVVMIFPSKEEGEIRTSEEAREAVFTLVDPKKRGLQIRSVRRIHGNGIAVETTNAESLKAFTENAKLKEAGLRTRKLELRKPRLIIYDVPRDMSEKEIRAGLRKQNENFSKEEVAELQFCFRTGRKDSEDTNWVVEAPPALRKKMLDTGRVFIIWKSCKVADFLAVSRCFRCQGHGHIAKYCRHKQEVCSHCGKEGHGSKTCLNKDLPAVCVNCKRAGKKGDHAASSAACPGRITAVEKSVSRTNYGN